MPHEQAVTIQSEGTYETSVTLKLWAEMNEEGWYSGDTHMHRSPAEADLAVMAEDINFAANITLWNEKNAFKDTATSLPENGIKVIGPRQAISVRGQEIEHFENGWGAILFLGDYESISLIRNSDRPWPSSFAAAARQAGAHLDHEKPIWSSVPICAALGLVDSVGLVHNHFWPNGYLSEEIIAKSIITPFKAKMSACELAEYTLELYYHLLNCGLRIGASGGSASGVMPSQVGYERTYVKLEDDFSADKWLEGLRAGRSFDTNGPILTLQVNGRDIGDVIQLSEEMQELSIQCSARSQGALERLDIIHNGEVLASSVAGDDETTLSIKIDKVFGPGWIAARCFEKVTDTQVYAATSPIYLEKSDKPFCVEKSVRFYMEYIQSVIDKANDTNQFKEDKERENALLTLQEAYAFYASRLPTE